MAFAFYESNLLNKKIVSLQKHTIVNLFLSTVISINYRFDQVLFRSSVV